MKVFSVFRDYDMFLEGVYSRKNLAINFIKGKGFTDFDGTFYWRPNEKDNHDGDSMSIIESVVIGRK